MNLDYLESNMFDDSVSDYFQFVRACVDSIVNKKNDKELYDFIFKAVTHKILELNLSFGLTLEAIKPRIQAEVLWAYQSYKLKKIKEACLKLAKEQILSNKEQMPSNLDDIFIDPPDGIFTYVLDIFCIHISFNKHWFLACFRPMLIKFNQNRRKALLFANSLIRKILRRQVDKTVLDKFSGKTVSTFQQDYFAQPPFKMATF